MRGPLTTPTPWAIWLARALAWAIFGMAGGFVFGIVSKSSKKIQYGMLGGVIGAVVLLAALLFAGTAWLGSRLESELLPEVLALAHHTQHASGRADQARSGVFARLGWIANLGGSFSVGVVLHLFPDLAVALGLADDVPQRNPLHPEGQHREGNGGGQRSDLGEWDAEADRGGFPQGHARRARRESRLGLGGQRRVPKGKGDRRKGRSSKS